MNAWTSPSDIVPVGHAEAADDGDGDVVGVPRNIIVVAVIPEMNWAR